LWQLRATRRWFRCLTLAGEAPDPALARAYTLAPDSPHVLELVHRFFAPDLSESEQARRLAAIADLLPDPDPGVVAAIALAEAGVVVDEGRRKAALRRAVAADPAGARGRQAAAILAGLEPPLEAIRLLRVAIAPHRSVLASLGHGDFAGTLEAARNLLKLCEQVGDSACAEQARRRLVELAQ
jgi:hypothetical protein